VRDERIEVIAGDIPPYAQIPVWLLLTASSHACKLYGILAAHINQDRGDRAVWPYRSTLAQLLGFSKTASVDRYINELETLGAIRVVPQVAADGGPAANVYVIYMNPQTDHAGPMSMSAYYANNKTAGQTLVPQKGLGGSPSEGTGVVPQKGHITRTRGTRTTSSSSDPSTARQSQPSHRQEEEEAKAEPKPAGDLAAPVRPPHNGGDGQADDEHQAGAAELVSSLPATLTRGNRRRLLALVVAALAAGWTTDQLRAELLRDLGSASSRVGVWITRLRDLGDPPAAAQARAALPPRCDHPDHDQYGTDRLLYPANGPARPCPTCHPAMLGRTR